MIVAILSSPLNIFYPIYLKQVCINLTKHVQRVISADVTLNPAIPIKAKMLTFVPKVTIASTAPANLTSARLEHSVTKQV